jgi:ABC-type branched-subunit amino acid transport system substrate-binding protein
MRFMLLLLVFSFAPGPAYAQQQPGDSALFREGEILFSRGDTERALWRFKRLLTEFPGSPLQNEAKFKIGICYTHLKRPKDANAVLNELLSTFLSAPRMVQVFTLIGDNHLDLGDPFNSLHWYGKGLLASGQAPARVSPQANDELKKKIRFIMERFDKEEDLNRVESLYRGAYAGGYAKFRIAHLVKRQGNETAAKRILAEWEKEYPRADYGDQGKDLLDWYPNASKSKYAVGVVLPLSGIHQPFGERALQAIQLALPKEPEGKPLLVSLVVRDSKGNPAEAERAVEELVTKGKVIAVIGPLLTATVERAARKAQQLKVPLLTLSQKEGLPGKGEFVFQNSLTPSDQIKTLVAYAMNDLELRTFGVFYPNSPYGAHFKNLFTEEVSRRRGKIAGVVVYQEEQTDFGEEIRGFFKIKTLKKKESDRRGEDEFIPGVSLDGLFIPDVHDRVGLILSQLAFYDIAGVTFLGTNGLNGPGLISIARKAAEGTVFVDAFYKHGSNPKIPRFMEEFKKAQQREPETLEALSYDVAKLLFEILRSKGATSSIQLKEQIRQIQNFQGVSGLKGFGEDGQTLRSLSILRVKNGKIEQVSP